jgi:hypothetical protein
MGFSLNGDFYRLKAAINASAQAARVGMNNGVRTAGDYVLNEARQIALLDTGNLRKSMKRDKNSKGGAGGGTYISVISSNAYAKRGKQAGKFNYAFYHHETRQTAAGLTPGTTGIHIKVIMQSKQQQIFKIIEDELGKQLKAKGW